ncbi:hypothetical protein SATMO3_62080 [Sporomusa aerivorans]
MGVVLLAEVNLFHGKRSASLHKTENSLQANACTETRGNKGTGVLF